MGGHHEARDGRLVSVWRFIGFLLTLSKEEMYGEVTFRLRKGEVVGQVHIQKDYLVEMLPTVSIKQMQDDLQRRRIDDVT